MHWITWSVVVWLVAVGVLAGACDSGGQPGTPQNHPLLWLVGISVAFCMLMAGVWFGAGVVRRWERRADRHE